MLLEPFPFDIPDFLQASHAVFFARGLALNFGRDDGAPNAAPSDPELYDYN